MSDETENDSKSEVGDPCRFDLPAVADIRMAAEIQSHCRDALHASGDVRIGCETVERIDAAVLQCIVALRTGLDQGERRLELADRTPAFTRAVDLLGFTQVLKELEPTS